MKTNHIYICDLQSILQNVEIPHVNKWNQVQVSIKGNGREMNREKEIDIAVRVYWQQNILYGIRFRDPRMFPDDGNLWQQRQPPTNDWESLEDDMHCEGKKGIPSEYPTDEGPPPPSRRELQLQGPRPAPLSVSEESHKIRNLPQLVIIHVPVNDFMKVVQRLTGQSSPSQL
ncbi:uncharacterized protein LOC129312463 [Prosopis cineraria]|uniref:uncharacterized protein LOC129312463 n=1 Tax=Prosopis cineraria TaxID=364024 RepID=UPI00240F263B|nr:uncharacterized protein LOC129312463 [Prosopis cineraria]